MPRNTDSAVISIFFKDLRTNRPFLAAAGLAHLLYVALIAALAVPEWYQRAVAPLARLGLSDLTTVNALGLAISILLALAIIVLVQSDGLNEPLHDFNIRPVTPLQILGAKFVGIWCIILVPRSVMDVLGCLQFQLSLPDGCVAATIHLLAEAPFTLFVIAVAALTRSVGQAVLAIGTALVAFVAFLTVPDLLARLGEPGVLRGSTPGPRADLIAFLSFICLELLALGALTVQPKIRAMRTAAVVSLFIFPLISAIDHILPPWQPKWPDNAVLAQSTIVSAETLPSEDARRLSGDGPDKYWAQSLLSIRTISSADWLTIEDGTISTSDSSAANWPTFRDSGVFEGPIEGDRSSLRRFLRVQYSKTADLGRVNQINLAFTRLYRIGSTPIFGSHRYRPVPGGGACRFEQVEWKISATCVGAVKAPCVSFGYPLKSCPDSKLIQGLRWPFALAISSQVESIKDASVPRDPAHGAYAMPTFANVWRNDGRFTRNLKFSTDDFRNLIQTSNK